MKKVLSIVLALAMVLCMIPALSADTKADRSYGLHFFQVNGTTSANVTYTELAATETGKKANSLTVNYNDASKTAIPELKKVPTGFFEEDAKMGLLEIWGFEFNDASKVESIVINGKALDVDDYAIYKAATGAFDGEKRIAIPVELADGGYSVSYSIVVTYKNGDVKVTETAEISLKLVDKTKATKTKKIATITDIKAGKVLDSTTLKETTAAASAEAYIVGSKIYIDFEDDPQNISLNITFADENKAPFTKIVWATNPKKTGFATLTQEDARLSKSAATYMFLGDYSPYNYVPGTVIYNKLDGSKGDVVLIAEDGNYYLDKDYTIIVRTNVHEADPKGIYLEKAEATIAVGEEYVPVVKAASNGAVVKPSKLFIYDSYGNENTTVLDYVGDKYSAKIIGVKPGVAYIKALYKKDYAIGNFAYTSSAQKITVTLPGTSIPPQTVDYVVTCRNLNVRKGAGTSFGKAGMIHRGDVVKVVEITNGWAKLADGTYVCAKYITK